MKTNPYLAGNFAPVADETTATQLDVTGQIPPGLEGRLLRIGPNPVNPDPKTYHWFMGNGMVHGVRLRGGRAEWYRSRFVRDDEVVEARGWQPVSGPRPAFELGSGVANTNIICHAGRFFAVVEAGNLPVEVTPELETVARSDFDGTLPGSFTAHPKRDPDTGELHAAVYSPLAKQIQYLVVGTDGRVRRHVEVPRPESPMVHDCAITAKYFLLLDFPVVFKPGAAAALPYQWTPDYGARVGLLPREGAAEDVIWCEVEPCFVFHPMNAYDREDGCVVLDVARHPRMFATDVNGPNEGPPRLERWVCDPAAGRVKTEILDERAQEFPRHDERLVGKPYRFGYCAGDASDLAFRALLKHDLRDGKVEAHREADSVSFMEPVFVATNETAAEDDGYVMAYTYDASRDRSDVVILHAQDFAAGPVARIHLPTRVPYGFHGNWVADA